MDTLFIIYSFLVECVFVSLFVKVILNATLLVLGSIDFHHLSSILCDIHKLLGRQ